MTYKPTTYTTTIAGLRHKLRMINIITQNVSNVSTISYKRQIPESLSFNSILNDVALHDESEGVFKKTNNNFDLAIEGNAYFLVDSKEGPIPIRNGKFKLNEKGNLVTDDGYDVIVIDKTDKPVSLASTNDIKIDSDGEIFVGTEKYGRIALQILDNKPVRIHQGYVEGSNVDLISEMTALSMTFRSFEASEKTLGMEMSVERDLIEKYGRNV